MIFNGKNIFDEEPQVADINRRNYVDGISAYIKRLNNEAKDIRREFMPPEELAKNPEKYRALYREMLGLNKLTYKDSSRATKEYVASDDVSDIYRLTVYITEEIPFYAMLIIPKDAPKPYPVMIAQHGGGGTPELCLDYNGKNNYNHMAQRALAMGYAILAPQIMVWRLEGIETAPARDVPYDRHGPDNELKRHGLSITGLEIKGILSCLDYVLETEDEDSEKISMVGLSYGGYFTLHTMAADTRIKSGYPVASFNDRDVYSWKDWTFKNAALTFHDAEIAGLCAPRKLYIQVGKEDQVFDYKSAVTEAERIYDYYKAYGKEENFKFRLWEGGHTLSDDDEGFDFIKSAY